MFIVVCKMANHSSHAAKSLSLWLSLSLESKLVVSNSLASFAHFDATVRDGTVARLGLRHQQVD